MRGFVKRLSVCCSIALLAHSQALLHADTDACDAQNYIHGVQCDCAPCEPNLCMRIH